MIYNSEEEANLIKDIKLEGNNAHLYKESFIQDLIQERYTRLKMKEKEIKDILHSGSFHGSFNLKRINKLVKQISSLSSEIKVLESYIHTTSNPIPLNKGVSNITKSIINDLVESDLKGVEEYGTNVDREDYDLGDWLKETYQEMLDSTKYLQASIKLYESKKTI